MLFIITAGEGTTLVEQAHGPIVAELFALATDVTGQPEPQLNG